MNSLIKNLKKHLKLGLIYKKLDMNPSKILSFYDVFVNRNESESSQVGFIMLIPDRNDNEDIRNSILRSLPKKKHYST